ncbi:hypothetical protein [Conexibacter sp. CPCC 206217]|uniref:hypothetical protein n=1 Tax=Conexibacter sp. CPCC 206217 TaxID=3064574 RepID=UPI00271F1E2A|nr:hypothetical protein [Conexibacter sp. CPCC 206217]MDO8213464.1 hypothetical protein [Conexibacter sp. CPCC 206217]
MRFDDELWNRICLYADVLGVANAALIRAAVREYLTRIEADRQLGWSLREQVAKLLVRVRRIEKAVYGDGGAT